MLPGSAPTRRAPGARTAQQGGGSALDLGGVWGRPLGFCKHGALAPRFTGHGAARTAIACVALHRAHALRMWSCGIPVLWELGVGSPSAGGTRVPGFAACGRGAGPGEGVSRSGRG